jgi:hypothetical protein
MEQEAIAEAPLDTALGNFMAMTPKSTVAVIVPMYGYWNDIKDNPVNGEVLATVLKRIYSNNVHYLYFIFVAHPQSIEHTPNDPNSVGGILIKKVAGGNVINVAVKRDATYAEYVSEGLATALEETKAQYITIFNPWTLIQDGSFDVLVDRANYGDNAKIISGFDMRTLLTPEQLPEFDTFKTTMPREEYDISFNFCGMPRYVAEMLNIDTEYTTHQFVERDLWQQMHNKGFDVISTQRVPIYPFDFPWSWYETEPDFDADLAHFSRKWGFNPGLTYKGDEYEQGVN